MKAIRYTTYGDLKNSIRLMDIDKPSIKSDEVLIEVFAAGVNPLDIKVVKGELKRLRKYNPPATMGHDVSGRIIEIGQEVTDLKVGDEVFAYADRQGTFAEFVAMDQKIVSLKPKNISHEEAASLPLVSLAAAQSLKRGKLKENEKILIHAGSGGVGSVAIQLAKSLGAYVYTTTSTDNVKWVKELGADRVIDYKTEDYLSLVQDVDMVLDTLGGQYTEDAFKVIKDGGRVISLLGPVDEETANRMKLNTIAKLFLAWKRRRISKQIKRRSAYYSLLLMRANKKQLDEIADLVNKGELKTNIDTIYPFEEGMDAILHVAKGRTKGKVVINKQE